MGTYRRPPFTGSQFKHALTPRIVEKDAREVNAEAERIRIKRVVFARDAGLCRCCKTHPAVELHELRFRSLGGRRSRENSIAVCTYQGAHCHRRLQTNLIDFTKLTWRGAGGPLEFRDTRTGRRWLSLPPNRTFRLKGQA